jgi:hypothetical protein
MREKPMDKKSQDLKRWYSQRLNDLYLRMVEAQERSPEELQKVIDAEAGAQYDFIPRDGDFTTKDVVH